MLELDAYSVDLTRLTAQFDESTEYAGKVDLLIDLETQGKEVDEVRANLQGSFAAMLRDGALVNEYSRAFSFNFLRVSVPSFGVTPDGPAPVHCFLVVAPIENGVAEMEEFYLEGQRITVSGRGRMDLANDELDLRLTPRLHEPGLVSVAATVEVTGAIGSPEIRAIRRSMVTSAVGALFRNVFRPVTAASRAFGLTGSRTIGEGETRCTSIARERIESLGAETDTADERTEREGGRRRFRGGELVTIRVMAGA